MVRIDKVLGCFFVCLFLAGSPAIVHGQVLPFQCTANAAVPPTIRSEGLAELVGDLVLDCTGGTGASGSANFTMFINTAITSNILGGDTTEALLLIDEPSPGSQTLGVNAFQGTGAGGNSITWIGIPIVQPGAGNHRIFRLTNIRANATAFTPTPGIPATIQSLISVAGAISVPILNPTQVLAFAQPGGDFSVTPTYFKQWLGPGLLGNPTEFTMTFTENFPTAFKKESEVNAGGNPIFQNFPGLIYSTESGFTSSATGGAGFADNGTRLVARFNNVPAGVSLSVPTQIQSSDSLLVARLYSGVNSDFSGGSIVPGPGMSPVSLAGGAGFAVWEITGSANVTGSLNVDHFTIPVTVSYFPDVGVGIPAMGMATVSGSIAPISTANTMSLAAPEPRFVGTAVSQGAFVIRSTDTFQDALAGSFASDQIEILAAAGITAGCSPAPPLFCPDGVINRWQMAVFMETSLGASPAATCTGMFSDVNSSTVGDVICGFIEDFANRGISGGCSTNPPLFCPDAPITRGQMAVFIETGLGNPANTCTGRFTDVPIGNPFCGFIERLDDDGITGGCGGANFCPDNPVTRAQMAVFLVAAPSPLSP